MRKFEMFCFLLTMAVLVSSAVADDDAETHHLHKKDGAKSRRRDGNGMSYICPPNFMRLSYKCYYFSNNTATWQEAYWKCRDMKSNIATIKNGNQDKIIRRTLDHRALVPRERWIGARYDWGTMSWKWAASGRAIQFQGFGDDIPIKKENLDWHCIVLDPKKHYRWSSVNCIEKKHYICQTKIRIVDNKDKRKFQQQYDSKINEVPVPDITRNEILSNDIPKLENNRYLSATNRTKPDEFSNDLSNVAFAYRQKPRRKFKKKDAETSRKAQRTRRNKHKKFKESQQHKRPMEKFSWKTYYEATKSPLHPRIAVEEFTF